MNKYTSRKFIVTILVITLTAILASLGVMNTHVALVFASAISSYNIVNGWVVKKDG